MLELSPPNTRRRLSKTPAGPRGRAGDSEMLGLYATPGEGPWTESARRATGCIGSFRARLRAEAEDRGMEAGSD